MATAGILTIGNEVVDGQITNRNASWLASELVEMGFEVSSHLSVNDNNNEILKALQFLESQCQAIIVTGGLGPTADDLTRQALALWNSSSLQLSESHWAGIQKKLEYRKLTIREGHKTQAEFPQGSTPIDNPKGVAPGFYLKKGLNLVAALPGPPRELHAMWNESLKPVLLQEFKPQRDKKLYTWICLGAPESEIAHIVESVIKDKNLAYGFRLHKPYVEVKIWAPENLTEGLQNIFQKITEGLTEWHIGTSIDNIRSRFYDCLSNYSQVYVVDHLSKGLFLDRLKEYKLPENMRYQTYLEKADEPQFFEKDVCLSVVKALRVDNQSLCIGFFPKSSNSTLIIINDEAIEIDLPRNISSMSQLGQLYTIETLFTEGYKTLKEQNG